MTKRLKTEPTQTVTVNPLSDSESDSLMQEVVADKKPEKKKKKKTSFQKFEESVSQTNEELQRRDRRLQRFELVERSIPPRTDTPDYVRDAQIAASIVRPPSNLLSRFACIC